MPDPTELDRVGLCLLCRHSRRITSDRGSTFYLCQLSLTDPNFPKYPRLPITDCSGYESPEPHSRKPIIPSST